MLLPWTKKDHHQYAPESCDIEESTAWFHGVKQCVKSQQSQIACARSSATEAAWFLDIARFWCVMVFFFFFFFFFVLGSVFSCGHTCASSCQDQVNRKSSKQATVQGINICSLRAPFLMRTENMLPGTLTFLFIFSQEPRSFWRNTKIGILSLKLLEQRWANDWPLTFFAWKDWKGCWRFPMRASAHVQYSMSSHHSWCTQIFTGDLFDTWIIGSTMVCNCYYLRFSVGFFSRHIFTAWVFIFCWLFQAVVYSKKKKTHAREATSIKIAGQTWGEAVHRHEERWVHESEQAL